MLSINEKKVRLKLTYFLTWYQHFPKRIVGKTWFYNKLNLPKIAVKVLIYDNKYEVSQR